MGPWGLIHISFGVVPIHFMSPVLHQAITWTNPGLLSIRAWKKFRWNLNKNHFQIWKCIWICCLPNWWPFCPRGDELIPESLQCYMPYNVLLHHTILALDCIEPYFTGTGNYIISLVLMKQLWIWAKIFQWIHEERLISSQEVNQDGTIYTVYYLFGSLLGSSSPQCYRLFLPWWPWCN